MLDLVSRLAVLASSLSRCATTDEAAETLLTLEIVLINTSSFSTDPDQGFTVYGYVVDRPTLAGSGQENLAFEQVSNSRSSI